MKQLTEQQMQQSSTFMQCVQAMLDLGTESKLLVGFNKEVFIFLEDSGNLLETTIKSIGRPVDLILCVGILDSSDKDTTLRNREVLKDLETTLISYVRDENIQIFQGYKFEDITLLSRVSKDGKEVSQHLICTCLSEDCGVVQ